MPKMKINYSLPQYPANRTFPAAKATTVVHVATNKNLLHNPDRIRETPPHYKPWDKRPVIKQYTDYLGNVSAQTEVVKAFASNSTLLQSTTRTLRETPPTAPLISGNFWFARVSYTTQTSATIKPRRKSLSKT